ncbi:Antirepressor protein Ant [Bibersteinia trehalosi USDA-ARS-USMARC-189]|uniref:Antirepressor protein Ant n=2 Tax=Bibersteinia trehalosi TaxID=47735 RepID=W0R8A5_BIBTR|nr:P22AR C-terminal domain-containing protein [Bibersteinia trehalosi]AHG83075.1 Antirepressor protein Ant [Bibersteinia trehalosi USDA-ARS-USMARC-189]AHG87339.1 Antirepressor protein Ant [Bibersteinia trehalosi USDA-ARS-USMARC-190]
MTTQISTQSQLSTFNFENSAIRVIAVSGEPWFVAKDVCDAIGIDNNRKALLALDDDEKGVTLSNTLGGQQEMNIISESGMYTLILRCREAVKKGSVPHRFRKWVTAEVLSQIRKTGQYSQNNQQIAPLAEPKITMELTKKEWLRFASMWYALYNSLEVLATLEKPLRAIGSPFGATAYTHATEYQTTLGVMKRILEPMLADFEVDPFEEAHYHKALTTLRQYQPKGSSGLVRI